MGFNLKHISKVLNLLKFIPQNYNLVKRVYTAFNTLHYDANEDHNDSLQTGILYSLTGNRVHELRGNLKLVSISEKESYSLINLAASICEPKCLLDVLNLQFFNTMENRRKGDKVFKNIASYIRWILLDPAQKNKLQQKATRMKLDGVDWQNDIEFLVSNKYIITTLKVYSQALIHSNLFDAYIDYNKKFKVFTLQEMVEIGYKKPFVSYIHRESGILIINTLLF